MIPPIPATRRSGGVAPDLVRAVLAALALLLAAPHHAAAQWVLIQPFAGLSFGGDTNILDFEDATKLRKAIYGATVTVIGRGVLGAEGDFAYVPGFFERGDSQTPPPSQLPFVTSSRVVTLMGNIVVAAPLRWTGDSLRPYVSGGVGLMRTRFETPDSFSVSRSLLGMNVGGGAMGFFSERVGVRWDVRYLRSLADLDEERAIETVDGRSPRLGYWRATTALVLKY